MDEYVSRPVILRRALESMLSEGVRPLLRSRGFAKSGRTFRRTRGPLYDMINFQGSKWNAVTPRHEFFVNVGLGSAQMGPRDPDPGWGPGSGRYVIDTRWETLAPGAPNEVTFDESTDMDGLADTICTTLGLVLDVFDAIGDSAALAQWMISHGWFDPKVCSYLVSVDDTETLIRYVALLHERRHGRSTWPWDNRRLLDATGGKAQQLIALGLLDPHVE